MDSGTRLKLYAESSAILAWLLHQDPTRRVRALLDQAEVVIISDLALVECDRALIRFEALEELSEAVVAERRAILTETVRFWTRLRLDDDVMERARRAFPSEPMRALDALHLASALIAGRNASGLSLLTLDERIRRAGRALGFDVVPNGSTKS